MNLSLVTCSGANEHTDIEGLVSLLEETFFELGIQVSGEKASHDSDRYWWIKELYYRLKDEDILSRFALHLNRDWVERFCFGELAPELKEFLAMRDCYGFPFFGRVQLNFKIGRDKIPGDDVLLNNLTRMINLFPEHTFILSYNDANAEFIRQLYWTGIRFDCLYDNSFGEGILPSSRPAPVFGNVFQGYAGGLTPENVEQELDKISRSVHSGLFFFIDAEGGLKGNDGHLSLEKCRTFLKNAYHWQSLN